MTAPDLSLLQHKIILCSKDNKIVVAHNPHHVNYFYTYYWDLNIRNKKYEWIIKKMDYPYSVLKFFNVKLKRSFDPTDLSDLKIYAEASLKKYAKRRRANLLRMANKLEDKIIKINEEQVTLEQII